ncbi:MAG: hypothetical protein AB1411_15945 [Nitrospirota bacterium]
MLLEEKKRVLRDRVKEARSVVERPGDQPAVKALSQHYAEDVAWLLEVIEGLTQPQ